MSAFPKSARHPDVVQQIKYWDSLSQWINVEDDSELSDIPELAIAARHPGLFVDEHQFRVIREIVGAKALKAVAKSYEALDGMAHCNLNGVTLSAMVQAYNASFFAAKGFCMLMGFAPVDRDSRITIDAFGEQTVGKGRAIKSTEAVQLYRFARWGHDEVWKLTMRLLDTVIVPDEMKPHKEWLRRANLVDSAKTRNAFQYNDSRLTPLEDPAYMDFPDRTNTDIFDEEAPTELNQQFFVTQRLIALCNIVMREAKLSGALLKCASKRRQELPSESSPQHTNT